MSGVRLVFLGVVGFLSSLGNATPAEYQQLVHDHDYWKALRLVCQEFGLGCGKTRFVLDRVNDPSGSYGFTDQIGRIHINVAAFHHGSEQSPHPGWLAAIVGHELIHKRQGSFSRIYAQVERIYGGSSYILAAHELEAWGYMLDNARRFRLNCSMVLEIEMSREYYEWVVNHKGARPPDDIVPTRTEKYNRLLRDCKSWQ